MYPQYLYIVYPQQLCYVSLVLQGGKEGLGTRLMLGLQLIATCLLLICVQVRVYPQYLYIVYPRQLCYVSLVLQGGKERRYETDVRFTADCNMFC